ncbi:MAG: DUF721 domain-containing protein [Desulfatitalea sp.]|nr:DUF721 domain-containing protein [Desulfatitalea sp.]
MSEKRPHRKTFAPIGDVIDTVLRQCRPATDHALLKVWEVWPQAVGSAVAAHARPVAFKGDLLLVHVDASSWLHHLCFLEQEMCRNLNHHLGGGHVKRIKLKIGSF